MVKYRIEKDFLGEKKILDKRYYGIQTLRAKENFRISEIPIYKFKFLVKSLVQVKKACVLANQELELLDPKIANAIIKACDKIIEGNFQKEFIVDSIQGGAGTSTNMNANEVIANIALEILGYDKGSYHIIHPNNHVNLSQSTNDVYPTALKITLFERISHLIHSMEILKKSFFKKSEQFKNVLKIGRTQLQDAVPMTLGQEFQTYAIMIEEDIERVKEAQSLILEVNLGGTAIGTGINSHPNYIEVVEKKLQEVTKRPFKTSSNLIEATQDTGSFVQISGVMKRVAVKISKICNDLRLLSSGPRAGLNEINLPERQAGSSIMPGKVNPVIPEVVNQVAFYVIGSDVTISIASEAGQLELNAMEPVIAFSLINSIQMMQNSFITLAEKCVNGITANESRCREFLFNSISLITALQPILGYEKCGELAKESLKNNDSIYNTILNKGYLKKEELDEFLKPENMLKPKIYRHQIPRK